MCRYIVNELINLLLMFQY